MRYQIRLAPLHCALLLPLLTHASSASVPGLARKTLAGTVSLEIPDENVNLPGHRNGFPVRPNSLPQTSNALNER
jgi:hypothetical protein